jgi:hypothetical protein
MKWQEDLEFGASWAKVARPHFKNKIHTKGTKIFKKKMFWAGIVLA